MSSFGRELRLAARTLLRKPGFSTVSILTLALAIAACTLVYSLFYGVLLQPLPYPAADRLVQVWQVSRDGGRQGQFSYPNFEDLRDGSRAFAALAQYVSGTGTVLVGNNPLRAQVATVSAGFFDVFRTASRRGRLFADEDRHPGSAPVAVVSHGFWQRAMAGADPASVNIQIGDRPHALVGVMPPQFAFPEGVEIWTPREQHARNPHRTGHNWRVVGQLADGAPSPRRART